MLALAFIAIRKVCGEPVGVSFIFRVGPKEKGRTDPACRCDAMLFFPIVLIECFFDPIGPDPFGFIMCLAFIQPEHPFDEFKPDKGNDHQADDPPPRHLGERADFEIFQEGEDNYRNDQ